MIRSLILTFTLLVYASAGQAAQTQSETQLQPQPLPPSPAQAGMALSGVYQVVTLRNASDVASPAQPLSAGDSPIGETIEFTKDGMKIKDMGCDHWEILMTLVSVVNTQDPMLSDIHVPPADSPLSRGDQRKSVTFHYRCEGESFMHVYKVDDRVVVIPAYNSSRYIIAEKLLSESQILRLQAELNNVKFLDRKPNGRLDEPTLQALTEWSHYRLGQPEAYKFKRVAITENLLDTMGVLD